MRIVNIVDGFHPLAGYENNVLSKFMARKGHDYYIIAPIIEDSQKAYLDLFGKHDIDKLDRTFEQQTNVHIVRLHVKRFISGRAIWDFKSLIKQIKAINPDLLFFCGNDTYVFIRYMLFTFRRLSYKLIADSHMLPMASKNKFRKLFQLFYRLFVAPIINKNNILVIRWQNDDYIIRDLGLKRDNCPYISFGTDVSLFYPDESDRIATRNKYGIKPDEFVVMYAGKIEESKGVELLAKAVNDQYIGEKKLTVFIVGNFDESNDYSINTKRLFDNSRNRVIFEHSQPYVELCHFYRCADLSIFPKQCSLSFFDVQACGNPVLLEHNNINDERCSHSNGVLYEPNNVSSLRDEIVRCIELEGTQYRQMSTNAITFVLQNYNYEDICNSVESYMKTVLL